MAGRAIVVLCPHRPSNLNAPVLGHVAWGFEYADGSWNIGSSEGPGWPHRQRPLDNGFWWFRMANLNEAVHYLANHMRVTWETDYDYFKLLHVNSDVQPHPQQAERVADWIGNQPYLLASRNCMNDVYDVLKAYGGDLGAFEDTQLPSPHLNWIPNGWFNAIYAREYYRLPAPGTRVAISATAEVPKAGEPLQPSWRTPGSPDFIELARLDIQRAPAHDAIAPTAPWTDK